MARGKAADTREKQFVEIYLQTWNGTKAAKAAGYADPRRRAYEMLRRPTVQAQIQERLEEAVMKADEVLARLSQQARVDISEFVIEDSAGFKINWDKVRECGYLVKSISRTQRDGIRIEM